MSDYLNIRLQKSDTLRDLERKLNELHDAAQRSQRVALHLPRNFDDIFFGDIARTALIASAARRLRKVQVIDWGGAESEGEAEARFSGTIDGIGALTLAGEVANERRILTAGEGGEPPLLNVEEILRRIVDDEENLLEGKLVASDKVQEEPYSTRSMTFCAFDPEFPYLRKFHRKRNRDFYDILEGYRKTHLAVGAAKDYEQSYTQEHFFSLWEFVHQLVLNAFNHGRMDGDKVITPGLRVVKIRRYIAENVDDLLRRANGFDELGAFFCRTEQASEQNVSMYYSVSVLDTGLGIIERFCQMRPDIQDGVPETRQGRVDLINTIIREHLSSNSQQMGAGLGLTTALQAVRNLNGFVMLRTSDVWLYQPEQDQNNPLIPVSGSDSLKDVTGTYFNMIFPLHRPKR